MACHVAVVIVIMKTICLMKNLLKLHSDGNHSRRNTGLGAGDLHIFRPWFYYAVLHIYKIVAWVSLILNQVEFSLPMSFGLHPPPTFDYEFSLKINFLI